MNSIESVDTDLAIDRATVGAQEERTEPATQPVAEHRDGPRILIVDDEAAVADLIEAVLVSEGYVVAIARDGAIECRRRKATSGIHGR